MKTARRIIVCFIAAFIILFTIFGYRKHQYNQMPRIAKNAVAVYLTKEYKCYRTQSTNYFYEISKTKSGYTLRIAWSVYDNSNSYKSYKLPLYAKVTFDKNYKKKKITYIRINKEVLKNW